MYKVGDYVIYRKDVCKVCAIKEKLIKDTDYYKLSLKSDPSLTLSIPVDNTSGLLRDLISRREVEEIIASIPSIPIIESKDRMIENEYKHLMSTGAHMDLIKIIKTAHLRNKERADENKKLSERDEHYFQLAERYLYDEFSIVLHMSYEDTKKYVEEKVVAIAE